MWSDNIAPMGMYLTVILSVAGSAWSLSWWFSNQFKGMRNIMYDVQKSILDKLEYHERHDDKRFADVRDDIWDIRVRNAARDGLPALSSREKLAAPE